LNLQHDNPALTKPVSQQWRVSDDHRRR
jgi:hypothetical protein